MQCLPFSYCSKSKYGLLMKGVDGFSPLFFLGKDTVGIYQQPIFMKIESELVPGVYLNRIVVSFCVLELRVKSRDSMPAFLIMLQK